MLSEETFENFENFGKKEETTSEWTGSLNWGNKSSEFYDLRLEKKDRADILLKSCLTTEIMSSSVSTKEKNSYDQVENSPDSANFPIISLGETEDSHLELDKLPTYQLGTATNNILMEEETDHDTVDLLDINSDFNSIFSLEKPPSLDHILHDNHSLCSEFSRSAKELVGPFQTAVNDENLDLLETHIGLSTNNSYEKLPGSFQTAADEEQEILRQSKVVDQGKRFPSTQDIMNSKSPNMKELVNEDGRISLASSKTVPFSNVRIKRSKENNNAENNEDGLVSIVDFPNLRSLSPPPLSYNSSCGISSSLSYKMIQGDFQGDFEDEYNKQSICIENDTSLSNDHNEENKINDIGNSVDEENPFVKLVKSQPTNEIILDEKSNQSIINESNILHDNDHNEEIRISDIGNSVDEENLLFKSVICQATNEIIQIEKSTSDIRNSVDEENPFVKSLMFQPTNEIILDEKSNQSITNEVDIFLDHDHNEVENDHVIVNADDKKPLVKSVKLHPEDHHEEEDSNKNNIFDFLQEVEQVEENDTKQHSNDLDDSMQYSDEHWESETNEERNLCSGEKEEEDIKKSPNNSNKKKLIFFASFLILIIVIILAIVIPINKNDDGNETSDYNNIEPSSILSGTQSFNKFGKSVSISDSGNRVIVAGNSETALLHIYNVISDNELISTFLNCTLMKQNTNVVSASSAELSGDDNHLVISSKLNDASSLVQVFSLSSNGLSWIQMGENVGTFQDDLSLSISNDGSIIAIGVPSLSVNVYEFVDEKWSLLGSELTGTPDVVGFGTRISLSSDGNRVAVGTMVTGTTVDLNGYTSVYNFNGTDWFELGSSILIEAGGSSNISYAQTVSLSRAGDRLAIGYPGYSWNSNELSSCGLCRVYKYGFDDDDNVMKWMKIGESIIGESISEMLGKVVSLSGNGEMVAISSSPGNKVNVYEVFSDNVEFSGSFVSNDETFGTDIALSSDGTELLISAPGGNLYGETYLYYSLASSL